MGWNFKKELGRKAFHALWFFVLLGYLWLKPNYGEKAFLLPLSITIFFLFIELFRIEFEFKIPFFWRIIRSEEGNKFLGSTDAMLGLTLAITAFDEKIAIAAISMMVFGDLIAGLIGSQFGSKRLKNHKSLEGSLAEFFTNIIVGYLVLNSWLIIISMAIVATLIETFSNKINDNLLITIFSGFIGQLMIWFL